MRDFHGHLITSNLSREIQFSLSLDLGFRHIHHLPADRATDWL